MAASAVALRIPPRFCAPLKRTVTTRRGFRNGDASGGFCAKQMEGPMLYSVVRAEDSYVVTVEGKGLLKFASRRQAAKLVAHVMEADAAGSRDQTPAAIRPGYRPTTAAAGRPAPIR